MRYSILNNGLRLLTLVLLLSCAGAEPQAEPFQADWEFVVTPGQATKACLSEDEVGKLREALIRCQANACAAQ